MLLENIKKYKCFDIYDLPERYFILNKEELCVVMSKKPNVVLDYHFKYENKWYKRLKLCASGVTKNSNYMALSYYPQNNKNKTVSLKRSYIVFFCNNPNETIKENYEIDHIDRNPLNDTLDNLRYITKLDNMRNRDLTHQKERRRETMGFSNDVPTHPLTRCAFRYWCKNRELDINDFDYMESDREYWLESKRDKYIKKYYWKLKTTNV